MPRHFDIEYRVEFGFRNSSPPQTMYFRRERRMQDAPSNFSPKTNFRREPNFRLLVRSRVSAIRTYRCARRVTPIPKTKISAIVPRNRHRGNLSGAPYRTEDDITCARHGCRKTFGGKIVAIFDGDANTISGHDRTTGRIDLRYDILYRSAGSGTSVRLRSSSFVVY